MSPEDALILHGNICDSEKAVLERCRRSLLALATGIDAGYPLAPCVLTTFSIAATVSGTFLHAGMRSTRMMAYSCIKTSSLLQDIATKDACLIQTIGTLRSQQAGLPMPWLDQAAAQAQIRLEAFMEKLLEVVIPHFHYIKEILEVARMLTETGGDITETLKSYVLDGDTKPFTVRLINELLAFIDAYSESLEQLFEQQRQGADRLQHMQTSLGALLESGDFPAATIAAPAPPDGIAAFLSATSLGLKGHAVNIEETRLAISELEQSMEVLTKSLSPFVQSLVKLMAAWRLNENAKR